MSANDRQVAGEHYRKTKIQHWDFAAANDFDYFQGQITKYVTRWKNKNGIADLEKAKHFLEKYIEIETAMKLIAVENKAAASSNISVDGQPHPFGFDPIREGNISADPSLILRNAGKDI